MYIDFLVCCVFSWIFHTWRNISVVHRKHSSDIRTLTPVSSLCRSQWKSKAPVSFSSHTNKPAIVSVISSLFSFQKSGTERTACFSHINLHQINHRHAVIHDDGFASFDVCATFVFAFLFHRGHDNISAINAVDHSDQTQSHRECEHSVLHRSFTSYSHRYSTRLYKHTI